MLMRMRMCALKTALVCSLAAVLVGCGSGGDDDDDDDDDDTTPSGSEPSGPGFEVDVDPISEGDWYRPEVSTTWQWQLLVQEGETLNTSYDVDVYDIDLFDNDAATIEAIQAAGHQVVCYFSAGSSEDWREDFDQFTDADIGDQLDEWEGENWLDVTSENVLSIMLTRLDLAVTKGCDGVEPDNMDGFANDTGFALTANHQLGYNRRIANEAHDRGLMVLLKNDGDQAEDLVAYYDGSLNEECHAYEECDQLAPFTAAGKPIFNAEYADSESEGQNLADDICPDALAIDTRTLVLPWDLDDSFRFSCD